MGLSKYFGPSTLVTAAFIGPGTITLCSLTGASTGYSLLWVVLFSIFTTVVFQEMSARLGLITQEGLGEAMRNSPLSGLLKWIMVAIAFSAIIIGNAAYEAGNIAGAVLGLDLVFMEMKFWPLLIGILAGSFLFFGKYKVLEKLLIFLVILMSLCFIITVIFLRPNFGDIMTGFVPQRANFDDLLLIVGIIGTTVVPYNLFLHASSISEKYTQLSQLRDIRIENMVAIVLGGLITSCIIIAAGTVYQGGAAFEGVGDFAKQLEPLLGNYAKVVMALGFAAAGLTSAITAPLAAAYAARGLFGWSKDWNDNKFRFIWALILLIGVVISMTGIKPVAIIKFAQVANGLLLPIIAFFLIYLVNSKKVMGEYTNSTARNIVSIFVLIITILLATKTMINVFG